MAAVSARTTLDYALAYARHGWPVLPVYEPVKGGVCACSLGKGCPNVGKHPRTPTGFLDASTDTGIIRGWWAKWPRANVGIRTGAASSTLVLDIDPRHGGDDKLEQYLEDNGALPWGPVVHTGGGGQHYYFAFAPNTKSTVLKEGMDIRADGGFVVAPPSIHRNGKAYRWDKRQGPKIALPQAPEWIVHEQRLKRRDAPVPNAAVSEGDRHNYLLRTAGFFRRVGFNSDTIYASLADLNAQWCNPPLPDEELNKIAYSADDWQGGPALVLEREYNDRGNAQRFVDQHAHEVKHLTSHGWVPWQGAYWQLTDELGFEVELAKRTIDAMGNEMREEWDEKQREQLRKWQLSSGNWPRITAMLGAAKSDPAVASTLADFDKDPYLFNVYNGTIDLRTGKLVGHNRDDMISKLAPVWYRPDADCPTFMDHMHWITDGDLDLQHYLQSLFGYCMTASVGEQIFPVFYGSGQNGKSTLMNAIRAVMGKGYATPAPGNFLIEKFNENEMNNAVATMAGSRLVIARETSKRDRLNVARMKELTGEDSVKGRFLYKNLFEFAITFKIIYLTNNKPVITDSEKATWRRVRLVPFTQQIADKDRDSTIDDKLAAEKSGVLNWLLEGASNWFREGLEEPLAVRRATARYKDQSDPLGRFLKDNIAFGKGKSTLSELHQQYVYWCTSEGVGAVLGKQKFNDAIREREEFARCEMIRASSGYVWRGAMIKA